MSGLPKKKDPRLAAAQGKEKTNSAKQFFDSAEYETQKAKISDPKKKVELKTQAEKAPHLGQ
jgi:hypothetical protein